MADKTMTLGTSTDGSRVNLNVTGTLKKDGTSVSLEGHTHSQYLTSTGMLPVSASGARWGCTPQVGTDGVMEIGKYIDFHAGGTETGDYAVRFTCPAVVGKDVNLPSNSGTLALTSQIPSSLIINLEDNGSTTAGTWLAKTSAISSYADGQMFLYKVTVAGVSGGTTLNITGSNGTALGAKSIYISGTSKLTTHVGTNTYVLLVYNSSINGNIEGFRMLNFYNSDISQRLYNYTGSGYTANYWITFNQNTTASAVNGNAARHGAYDTTFKYQPSTGTLTVNKINLANIVVGNNVTSITLPSVGVYIVSVASLTKWRVLSCVIEYAGTAFSSNISEVYVYSGVYIRCSTSGVLTMSDGAWGYWRAMKISDKQFSTSATIGN